MVDTPPEIRFTLTDVDVNRLREYRASRFTCPLGGLGLALLLAACAPGLVVVTLAVLFWHRYPTLSYTLLALWGAWLLGLVGLFLRLRIRSNASMEWFRDLAQSTVFNRGDCVITPLADGGLEVTTSTGRHTFTPDQLVDAVFTETDHYIRLRDGQTLIVPAHAFPSRDQFHEFIHWTAYGSASNTMAEASSPEQTAS